MNQPEDDPSLEDITDLLSIMRRLRDPKSGCPWDLQQNFGTIAPYTIEEAYEVASSIEARDYSSLKDELGDLLFQVVFHAQMAEEQQLFAFHDVVQAVCAKMIRRHPHVFARSSADTPQTVSIAWDEIKRRERAAKSNQPAGFLDDVPGALPALMRAVKLQNRAAEVGFDWPSAITVAEKIAEETRELAEARESGKPAKVAEEFGDLLFAMANLARHLKLDPEDALRAANAKFVRRFRVIEEGLKARGRSLEEASLEEMEALWQDAKRREGKP
ncbi:MAG TPA: nucleoside triphosphate pyrophosphohydrolase [Micropepsaceae bacterium]|nr:nucleoside triphosphate pyrophosphohydrolase [Micropepsaceae bacterium]